MPGVSGPQVKLAELREYRSARGSTYFAGYMGRTRLVLLQDHDAPITGAEVGRWRLLVEEAPPREEAASAPARPARPPRPARRRPAAAKPSDRAAGDLLREKGIDPSSPIVDDEIGF